jgi:hypothetical protein
MANEVKTIFTGDASQLFKTADDVKKRLEEVGNSKTDGFKGLTKSVDTFGNALLTAQKKGLSLAQQFNKFGASGFQKESQNIIVKLQQIQSLVDKKPSKTVLAYLEAEAKRLKGDLSGLEQQLINIKSANIGKSSGGASNLFGSVAGSLPGIGAITQGAIVGGAAGAAAAAIIEVGNAAKNAAVQVGSLAAEAIKLGANLEGTVNAMTVFTGSTRAARAELDDIAALAKNTAGLGLIDARASITQLRGLGFEAKVAKDLLVGISKQKIINNADEGAIQRTLINLAQLKAGSPQVRKDIQQMILAFPALSLVIKDTFGNLDKFVKAVQSDPDAALKRFAAAMGGVQAPAAGLNDAFLKLTDAFRKTGEALAEPILVPITESTKNATALVEQHADAWAILGQRIGDVVSGLNAIGGIPEIAKLIVGSLVGGAGIAIRTAAGNAPGNIGAAGGLALEFIEQEGRRKRADADRKLIQGKFNNNPNILRADGTVDFSVLNQKTDGEIAAEKLNREREAQDAKDRLKANTEANNKAEVERLEGLYKQRASIVENGTKIEEALVKLRNDGLKNGEINTIKELAAVRQKGYQQQIAALTQSYQAQYKFLSPADQEKARIEVIRSVQQIQTQATVDQINSQVELASKERELAEKRKREAEERQRKAEEYRKKVVEIRDLLSDNFAQSSQNPFVKIFSDAEASINRAKEATKGFSNEIRNAAIASAQSANGGSLFRQRIDTRLQGFDLRTDAESFLNAASPYNRNRSNSLNPSRREFVGGYSAEQRRLQREVERKLQFIQNTPFGDIKDLSAEDRERYIRQSIIKATEGLKPSDLNYDLNQQAGQARLREATDVLKQEKKAVEFYQKMGQIITTDGLLVKGANQNVTVNAYGGATTDTSATPTRPAQNQTRPTR